MDLKSIYEGHGLIADDIELPDYLPLFCEFVSTLPDLEARPMLGEMAPLLDLIAAHDTQHEVNEFLPSLVLSRTLAASSLCRRQGSRTFPSPSDHLLRVLPAAGHGWAGIKRT